MRYLLSLIIIVLSLNLFSQDLDSEIRNYRESDKIYISKARQFLADEISSGNIEKARELTGHMVERFDGSLNLPFLPWEIFVLGLAVDSQQLSLRSVDHIVSETYWDRYIFPEKDAL